jgi:hypothetical protein
MTHLLPVCSLLLVMLATPAIAQPAAPLRAPASPPEPSTAIYNFPDDAVVNVQTAFGAVGDGVTDDTAALRRAIDETRGGNRVLYFPDGVYLISDSIGIFDGRPHSRDRFLIFQGQSEAGTIIRLAPRSEGFDDPAEPKIVVSMYEGQSTGDAMNTNARDLTIEIGEGNPGAAAFRYLNNNFGMIERLTIRSLDPDGAGAIGLDLRQSQQGPGLLRDITVEGFDRGIVIGNSFSQVFEDIDLHGQREVAIDTRNARVTFHRLRVHGAPLGLTGRQHAQVTIIDGQFHADPSAQADPSDSAGAAIVLPGPKVFLRDVTQTGWDHLIRIGDGETGELNEHGEYYALPSYSLFPVDQMATLRLPIQDAPDLPWDNDMDHWVRVDTNDGRDITQRLQQAIDQAAERGQTTIYLVSERGHGNPQLTSPVRFHGSVNRLVGMHRMLEIIEGPAFEDSAAMIFEDLDSDVFVIERFFGIGGWDRPNVVALDNRTDATMVLRNARFSAYISEPDPGGRWFLDDASPGRNRPMLIGEGQQVWARQFNPESPLEEMVHVDGGTLWIMGFKTEGRATHVRVTNGGRVEVLGGVSYQSWGNPPTDPPMFIFDETSSGSLTLGFYHHNRPFETVVEQARGNQTRELPRQDLRGYHLPLFRADPVE